MFHFARAALTVILISLATPFVLAQNNERFIEGPITARVIGVVDGDTIEVEVQTWLYTMVRTRVRLRGIDTAEINRALCQEEAEMGLRGLNFTTEFVIGDSPEAYVVLTQVTPDKFAGRVLASASNLWGDDLAEALLAAGVAKPYNGGPRPDWC